MSKSGGYCILDLKDTNLPGRPTPGLPVEGAYDALRAAVLSRKPVLVSGLRIGFVADAPPVLFPAAFGAAWEAEDGVMAVKVDINGQPTVIRVKSNDGVSVEPIEKA